MGNRRVPKHRRPVGRPQKILDENVRKALLAALGAGAPIELACEAASMSKQTFYTWMQRGHDAHETVAQEEPIEDTEQPYLDLYVEVNKARAAAALRNVGVIQKVANGGTVLERTTERDPDGTERVIEKRQAPDWRAAAWWLERSYKGPYRKDAEQLEVSGPGGGPVQITADAEDLAQRLSEHLAVGAATTPQAIESERVDVSPDDEETPLESDSHDG